MPQLELKIALDETGQIAISGPIENEIVCYYLLEKARQAVQNHHTKALRLVQPATLVPPNLGKSNGHV
jgi:hypothetical protein